MRIALDYDGTYSADPGLWDQFVTHALLQGHSVTCVTMRYPHELAVVPHIHTIYTSHKAKKLYVERVLGLHFDVWIDDIPEYLFQDAP
jgi:hypothetical protein